MENGAADLPEEYHIDVPRAIQGLTALAEKEPDAPVVLTLAQFGSGGLEAEQDIWLRAAEAAALLATVGEDQRLSAGAHDLILLRVVKAERWPRLQPADELVRERFPESWHTDD